MTAKAPDRIFLIFTIVLVFIGLLIFSSASLGLLARNGASFSSVAVSQLLFGVIGGLVALFITSSIHYRIWRQYAFYFLIAAYVLTFAVFIPGIGFSHGGATRWIDVRFLSFQPSEFLKIAFIIYMATWLSGMRKYIHQFKKGVLPFVCFAIGVGVPLLLQPDMDTYLILLGAALAMFVASGGKIKTVLLMGIVAVLMVILLASVRPYIKDRILTFVDPSLDPQGSGYQIKQSLIAVGSGGVLGRGFGQSIQKFEYLPEPIGDSIFAVYAEEFGFVGSCILILLFAGFIMRGFRIATHAPDLFSMLLVVGIISLLALQIFLNIAAMVGITPVSGLPLPFVSHGGTALFVTLASVGIVLNVSKYQKPKAL